MDTAEAAAVDGYERQISDLVSRAQAQGREPLEFAITQRIGPAIRHCARIRGRVLSLSPAVEEEIKVALLEGEALLEQYHAGAAADRAVDEMRSEDRALAREKRESRD